MTMTGKFPSLSKERQAEISDVLRTTSVDSREFVKARNELVLSCIPWAKRLTLRYKGSRFDMDDLLSVAVCAMYDVAHQFDSGRSTASTFFALKIKQVLSQYCWQNREVVKLPSKCNPMTDTKRPFTENVLGGVTSLSYPSNGHRRPLANYIVDHRESETILDELDDERMLGYVKDAMVVLDQRERGVIRARYFTMPRPTLNDVANQLGVTRERARQIEEKSIGKLKQFIEEKKMSETNGNGNVFDGDLSVYDLAQRITLLDYANIDVAIAQVDREIKIAEEDAKRELAVKIDELKRKKQVLQKLRKIAAPRMASKRRAAVRMNPDGQSSYELIAKAMRAAGRPMTIVEVTRATDLTQSTVKNHIARHDKFNHVSFGKYTVKE
jgi:RNA polymerase sigma factor (sigma-70 family)